MTWSMNAAEKIDLHVKDLYYMYMWYMCLTCTCTCKHARGYAQDCLSGGKFTFLNPSVLYIHIHDSYPRTGASLAFESRVVFSMPQ